MTHSATIRQLPVNQVELFYQEQGQGTPVVCVHGAMSDLRAWELQRDAIARRHRFIALTQRYFGTAPWADDGAQFSLATHADDLAAFIRAHIHTFKCGPVDLVGWSYSGAVVLLVALHHPELVRRLFVYEPGMLSWVTDAAALERAKQDRNAIFAAAAVPAKAGDSLSATRLLAEAFSATPGYLDSAPPLLRSMLLDNARTVPLLYGAPLPAPITSADLATLRLPVTLARGELTRPFYAIATDAASRCIAGAQHVVIPGVGHFAPWQNAALFNASVLHFLNETQA